MATLIGTKGNDHILGLPGEDNVIFGDPYTEGNDLLFGDAEIILASAKGGADRLDGGVGNDILFGDCRQLYVPADVRCGNDVLTGGMGDDQLYGDADPALSDFTNVTRGADRFVFVNGSGLDTIGDFQNDFDRIDLTGFTGIDNFGDLSPANVAQVGADTVIDLGAAAGEVGGPAVLTLAGFASANLDQTDFLFA